MQKMRMLLVLLHDSMCVFVIPSTFNIYYLLTSNWILQRWRIDRLLFTIPAGSVFDYMMDSFLSKT